MDQPSMTAMSQTAPAYGTIVEPAPQMATVAPTEQVKRLLIVDDEMKICELLSRFFTLRGFQTETAFSGREAIVKLNQRVPDYLLLDVRMPDISGIDVLKEAKATHPELKVVMVSAYSDNEIVNEAFRYGASDYITKPLALTDSAWARAFFSPA
jgi:DNA-binding NtrC family response regulator